MLVNLCTSYITSNLSIRQYICTILDTSYFAISVIICFMAGKLAPTEFILFLKDKMKEQNLGIRELARVLGVSHPTVSRVVTYGHQPSFDTCLAIAEWLKQSQIFVLREAGLLPPGSPNKVSMEDWEYIFSKLSKRDQEILKKTALSMIETNGNAQPVQIKKALSNS